MKKFLAILTMAAAVITASAASAYSGFKGVWSSDDAEAVVTDSVCIFYFRADSTMQAVLEIPGDGFSSHTVFAKDGTVSTDTGAPRLDIALSGDILSIGGHRLRKVEALNTVRPSEQKQCNSKYDAGQCLQQWRLGAAYGINEDVTYCEINTNRHMFVYMVSPSMVYIRAAAARNNNSGTLFFQNIRMMKNNNTGEYTMVIVPDNYKFTLTDLEIDNSRFQPDRCTFSPDGGIYWSLISAEPDLILLNGCGETYRVERPQINPAKEYFEYVPYGCEGKFF